MKIRLIEDLGDLAVWSTSGERGLITGNPHTHPGRFSVLWDGEAWSHPTSLYQLARVSPPAELWLAGFFAGQSPDPQDVLGDDIDDFLPDDQRAAWLAVRREFQETGKMPEAWLSARRARDLDDLTEP